MHDFDKNAQYCLVKGWFEKTGGISERRFYGACFYEDSPNKFYRVVIEGLDAITASKSAGHNNITAKHANLLEMGKKARAAAIKGSEKDPEFGRTINDANKPPAKGAKTAPGTGKDRSADPEVGAPDTMKEDARDAAELVGADPDALGSLKGTALPAEAEAETEAQILPPENTDEREAEGKKSKTTLSMEKYAQAINRAAQALAQAAGEAVGAGRDPARIQQIISAVQNLLGDGTRAQQAAQQAGQSDQSPLSSDELNTLPDLESTESGEAISEMTGSGGVASRPCALGDDQRDDDKKRAEAAKKLQTPQKHGMPPRHSSKNGEQTMHGSTMGLEETQEDKPKFPARSGRPKTKPPQVGVSPRGTLGGPNESIEIGDRVELRNIIQEQYHYLNGERGRVVALDQGNEPIVILMDHKELGDEDGFINTRESETIRIREHANRKLSEAIELAKYVANRSGVTNEGRIKELGNEILDWAKINKVKNPMSNKENLLGVFSVLLSI